MPRKRSNPLFDALKSPRHRFVSTDLVELFKLVDQNRVERLAEDLSKYISTNLPQALESRTGLADYRTNPYVLMTAASVMNLDDPVPFANFLFNSKLYMSLETSFGKSVEATLVGPFPIGSPDKWADAPEKVAEFSELQGLSREERARKRTESVWREIDRACVMNGRRYMTTIKSGPNTINDTQVQAMYSAIANNYQRWYRSTVARYDGVDELDIIVGLTYGTDRTTNNKENQILVKLLESGFIEEDRERRPGVLIDKETRMVRIYRRIGKDFWAMIGNPNDPDQACFVFLEILLGLAKALSKGMEEAGLEARINLKIKALANALASLQFSKNSLPEWIRGDFNENELFWFATAMSAFYDEGI